jgi:hypothetical protein
MTRLIEALWTESPSTVTKSTAVLSSRWRVAQRA